MTNQLPATPNEAYTPTAPGRLRTLFMTLSIVGVLMGLCPTAQAAIFPIGGGLCEDTDTPSQGPFPCPAGLSEQSLLNETQTGMKRVIETACPNGTNESEFQARCNALVTPVVVDETVTGVTVERPDALSALQRVSPEQIISQGTGATRTSLNVIGGRLASLRAGVRGFQMAALTNGQALRLAGLSPYAQGGAAGEGGSEIWDRLGVFVNGNYNTGNLDSSFNQLGYNFNSGSVTAGIDYRLTKDLILGTAFTYTRTETGFDRNGGSLDSDAFNGAFYGTYYATDALYFDGIATFGGINYDSIRHIQYTVPGDTVNANAKASPDGEQYSVSLGGGYNFSLQEWTLNPYARINYAKLQVDGFNERGGDGWAMGFSDQRVESVTTTVGSQVSYSLSTPWGVLLPHIQGEWFHEYKDNRRDIDVRFLGDTTSGLTFNTVTESPDRNYFTVGAGVSGTFAKGLTAFLNYNTLLGYRNVESHLFSAGARLEF